MSVTPDWQTPPAQTSFCVQALPSLQLDVLFVCAQLPSRWQRSVVQSLASLQVLSGPGWQLPATQTSFSVQGLASLQGAELGTCPQPVVGLQAALVQALASSGQVTGLPTQLPFAQASPDVQIEPSEQTVPFVAFVKTQPLAGLQASVVHVFPSLQVSGVKPGWQLPPEQKSAVVQGLPSLQEALLFVQKQAPVAIAHWSFVQGFASLQFFGPPA